MNCQSEWIHSGRDLFCNTGRDYNQKLEKEWNAFLKVFNRA